MFLDETQRASQCDKTNTFLKAKMEAPGWPEGCTEEDRRV